MESVLPANSYALDMGAVTFIKPYGAIALTIASRRLSHLSGHPVILENLAADTHAYLQRMDLFDVGKEWLFSPASLDGHWSRSSQTPNLLELTTITGPWDVETILSRAALIVERWLMLNNLGPLLRVLSELCTNVYDHSGDHAGCILMQRYKAALRGQVVVYLAVGDLGCGIRSSLYARHGAIGDGVLDYLHEALRGRSARATGRGGLGLRTIEGIIGAHGGSLWLRTETAAVLSRGQGTVYSWESLTPVPGTQIAVEFRAPATF